MSSVRGHMHQAWVAGKKAGADGDTMPFATWCEEYEKLASLESEGGEREPLPVVATIRVDDDGAEVLVLATEELPHGTYNLRAARVGVGETGDVEAPSWDDLHPSTQRWIQRLNESRWRLINAIMPGNGGGNADKLEVEAVEVAARLRAAPPSGLYHIVGPIQQVGWNV